MSLVTILDSNVQHPQFLPIACKAISTFCPTWTSKIIVELYSQLLYLITCYKILAVCRSTHIFHYIYWSLLLTNSVWLSPSFLIRAPLRSCHSYWVIGLKCPAPTILAYCLQGYLLFCQCLEINDNIWCLFTIIGLKCPAPTILACCLQGYLFFCQCWK